jgi:putative acetyltransferase
MNMIIRKIRPDDNKVLAEIIRTVMSGFKVDLSGTIVGDPSMHTMYENYLEERAVYFIAELNGRTVGGAGIRALEGSDGNICELQRMFLLPEARGMGTGKKLIVLCLEQAKAFGYKTIYLESHELMVPALSLYRRSGFERIEKPMGNTGHVSCNVFMTLAL